MLYMYATGNDFVNAYFLSNCIKTNKQFNALQKYFSKLLGYYNCVKLLPKLVHLSKLH